MHQNCVSVKGVTVDMECVIWKKMELCIIIVCEACEDLSLFCVFTHVAKLVFLGVLSDLRSF